jgi:hypothetical protein
MSLTTAQTTAQTGQQAARPNAGRGCRLCVACGHCVCRRDGCVCHQSAGEAR